MLSQPSYYEALAVQEDRREIYGNAGVVVIVFDTLAGGLFLATVPQMNAARQRSPSRYRRVTSDREYRRLHGEFSGRKAEQEARDRAEIMAAIEANKRRVG